MKVEIWSDVMCPFCYIGKRKFEAALETFPQKDQVEVVWHSFQLNPDIQYREGVNANEYLAELKGQSAEWAAQAHEQVAAMARGVGLDYHFDKVKIANSFDAHRLIQLAKKHGLDDALEERFFKAYFTEGALMSDHDTLAQLATEAGLPAAEVQEVLQTGQYAEQVHADGVEAQQLGVRGVPFFVIDRKYGISGAQDSSVFTQALQQAAAEG